MKKTEFSLSQTVMRLAELGLDETEIAYSLCLTKRKFTALMEQKEISDALEQGVEVRARRVEDALYRRAIGFEYEEVVNASSKPSETLRSDKSELPPFTKGLPAADRGTKGGSRKSAAGSSLKSSAKSTIKTVIPDVTACIFWLKNTLPDKWRDPKDVISGKKSFQELIEAYDEEEEET